ncbi:MAG: nicotinate-nucleotide adenylyltransferase [Burkholderiales bacterium]|jgi:nicotinate-nucleotide adenylyltransferase|nr:nicotinate-nucleotide adenylyltransferase [Burkholderiales bacterium]
MSSDRRRRVGILGGTFDPPHVGHLALARSARDAMQLDEVRLMPTGHSWQKSAAGASALQRLEMVRIALRDVGPAEGLRADDREVVRGGQTYTVDTLEALRKELGPDVMLVLIVGSDQLRNLATWRNWQRLFDLAHIAATQRERITLDDLPPEVEAEVASRGRDALPDAPAGSIVFFRMPAVAVSATGLRAQLAAGERPDALSPPAVLDYIQSHRLYRRSPRN